jgi:hypothetical protein
MYANFLFIHSWLRWIVLFLILIIIIKFSFSIIFKKSYSTLDRVLSSATLGTVHLQFIVGIILYFGLSPIVESGLSNIKAAMKNSLLRYWTIEHLSAMFIFVIFIQLGFSFSKRAIEGTKKHKLMLTYCIIGSFILLLSMPWPTREFGRALFRF